MRFPWMLCATAGLLTLSASAFAQDTAFNYAMQSGALSFNANYVTVGGTGYNDFRAGYFTATVPGDPSVTPFQVYCVDLEGEVQSPTTVDAQVVDVPPLQGGSTHYDGLPGTYTDLTEAAWLFNQYNAAAVADTTGVAGAALQAAIWSIVDGDTTYDIQQGVFRISQDGFTDATLFGTAPTVGNPGGTGIVGTADTYLKALQAQLALNTDPIFTNGMNTAILYQVDRQAADPNGQDMVGSGDGFNPHDSTTPEGASLLMFLPGLIPVAIGLRRRRNRSVGK